MSEALFITSHTVVKVLDSFSGSPLSLSLGNYVGQVKSPRKVDTHVGKEEQGRLLGVVRELLKSNEGAGGGEKPKPSMNRRRHE